MTNSNNKDLDKFVFAAPTGDGDFLDIVSQNNLNVFSTHIGYIAALASSGKISTEEAYSQTKKLYKSLRQSYKSLRGSWFG